MDSVEIKEVVDGSQVIEHERERTPRSHDPDEENVWDYYTLEDGRRCVYRNGYFWEWLS